MERTVDGSLRTNFDRNEQRGKTRRANPQLIVSRCNVSHGEMAVAVGRGGLYGRLIFGFGREQLDISATDRRALRIGNIALNVVHSYCGRTANLGVLQAAGTLC